MPHLSPQTLTTSEQQALLRATASHPRDHLIFSLALGTGLRLAEIVGLHVGDVYFTDGSPRVRVRLRPGIAKNGRAGDVFLPDGLMLKLDRFWRCKVRRGEDLSPSAPLFCSQSGQRISKRRVQVVFRAWQIVAGFDRLYPFHALRHTAVTNVSPLTTVIYTHPSDEELREAVRGVRC
jgi:integrase